MNIIERLPLTKLINLLSETTISTTTTTTTTTCTFDILKSELQKNKNYNVTLKESDDLCIIFNNDTNNINLINTTPLEKEVENGCRSIIIEKATLRVLGTQFNKILYNDEAIKAINAANITDLDNIVVQECYEGTMLLVYCYNNVWHVSTRRCLNAEDSTWIKNKSYREMFNEAMGDKFSFEELNPNYCYHFVLVHHKNRNIVSYNNLGRDYKELFHVMTTELYTLKTVPCVINDKVNRVDEEVNFNSLDNILESLDKISKRDELYHKITTEGYVLRVYEGEKYNSAFTIVKLQTNIYQKIMKLKPNNSNLHQSYLELYQKDQLTEVLPYFTSYSNDIITRVHTVMKNMAKEILNLYHITRQKNNQQLYNTLTDQYKKVLYSLHGIYIELKKTELKNKIEPTSINVHNVYHYLKCLPPQELRQLFFERSLLMQNVQNKFLNRNCLATEAQIRLMFTNLTNLAKK
jgi:hypothetical protein